MSSAVNLLRRAALLGLTTLAGAAVLGSAASAALTGHWRSTTYKDFDEGEPHGVMIGSRGEVVAGLGTTRFDAGVSVVWSSTTSPDGTAYLGTGDEGKVLVAPKGQPPKLLAALPGAVMVTALTWGAKGLLYAATLPEGRIFAIDPHVGPHVGPRAGAKGVRELVRLPDVEHIWALAWEPVAQRLWAATGPKGQLFAIDGAGKATQVLTAEDKHIMSLLLEKDALWLGTSDEALLLRLPLPLKGAKPRADVVQDFDGDEVRAIVRAPDGLYVAVNDFDKAKVGPATAGPPRPQRGTKAAPPDPTRAPAATSTGIAGTLPPPPRPFERKGRGAIFRVEAQGADARVEPIHALADGYFSSLAVDAQGAVFAGSAPAGKLFRFSGGKVEASVLTAADVAERQILSIDLNANGRLFTTGDSGALYRIDGGLPKEANYLSKVFDAEHGARFGKLRWLSSGSIAIDTRSGQTSKPDGSWSGWAPLTSVQEGKQRGEHTGNSASPVGRYFQWRARFGGADAALRELSTYFSPQNQRPKVVEVAADTGGVAPSSGGGPTLGPVVVPGAMNLAPRSRSPVVKLRWRAENPDRDELVYRVWFREEAGASWRPIGDSEREPLTRTELDWNTDAIPDGQYVVRVEASDERANPPELALKHELLSAPLLVDNRRPEVLELHATPIAASGSGAAAKADRSDGKLSLSVSGRAVDSFSPITELAYAIDGGDYHLLAAADGVLDDPIERFDAKLSERLASGTHVVALRATDSAGNLGSAQVTISLR